MNATNCDMVWGEQFSTSLSSEDKTAVCTHACGYLGRDVLNSYTTQTDNCGAKDQPSCTTCTCKAPPAHEEDGHEASAKATPPPSSPSTDTPTKIDTSTVPCAIAGLNGDDTTILNCPCPNYHHRFPMWLVGVWLSIIFVSLLIACIQSCATCVTCLVGCTRPVVDEEDIHWAKCCCSAGGALCCIPQMKLPALRTTTCKLVGLVLVEVAVSSMGFSGIGIILMGVTAQSATNAQREAYLKVGLTYFLSNIIIGILYVTIIGAGAAAVFQIFVSWCYICTLSALCRLPCRREYRERWLTAQPTAAVFDPESAPVVVSGEAATFVQVASAPLISVNEYAQQTHGLPIGNVVAVSAPPMYSKV